MFLAGSPAMSLMLLPMRRSARLEVAAARRLRWLALAPSINSSSSADILTFGSGPFNNTTQNGLYTLFYSKYADAWLVDITGMRGIISGVPIEVLVDIANATNTNLWLNIPCFLVHDGSHQQFAQIVKNRLNPQLNFAVEYCNEVWNGSFPQSGYAYYSAARWLGIGVEGDDRGIRSWNAYQAKLVVRRYADRMG